MAFFESLVAPDANAARFRLQRKQIFSYFCDFGVRSSVSSSNTMATSTLDANPGDTSLLEDDNDPDLSLETGDDPVSSKLV